MTTTNDQPRGAGHHSAVRETANDRFKRQFGDWFWGSLIAATLVHFGVFFFWPSMTAANMGGAPDEIEAIELPPEVEIPPPPQEIARPATPVIAEASVEEDITIAETTFEDNPIDELPPPPSDDGNLSDQPVFTPFTVAPELRNPREVQRVLEREYPPLLRDAGIGGRVVVWFFIDENGRVLRTQVRESSGHKTMDEAALEVAEVMRFSPALNRDEKVQVWVSLPITFSTR